MLRQAAAPLGPGPGREWLRTPPYGPPGGPRDGPRDKALARAPGGGGPLRLVRRGGDQREGAVGPRRGGGPGCRLQHGRVPRRRQRRGLRRRLAALAGAAGGGGAVAISAWAPSPRRPTGGLPTSRAGHWGAPRRPAQRRRRRLPWQPLTWGVPSPGVSRLAFHRASKRRVVVRRAGERAPMRVGGRAGLPVAGPGRSRRGGRQSTSAASRDATGAGAAIAAAMAGGGGPRGEARALAARAPALQRAAGGAASVAPEAGRRRAVTGGEDGVGGRGVVGARLKKCEVASDQEGGVKRGTPSDFGPVCPTRQGLPPRRPQCG